MLLLRISTFADTHDDRCSAAQTSRGCTEFKAELKTNKGTEHTLSDVCADASCTEPEITWDST